MNHRQWKKSFKKAHGRNPYPWEDKKCTRHEALELMAILDSLGTSASGIIANIGETLFDSLSALFEGASKMCGEIAKAFSDISDKVGD